MPSKNYVIQIKGICPLGSKENGSNGEKLPAPKWHQVLFDPNSLFSPLTHLLRVSDWVDHVNTMTTGKYSD